MTVHDFILDCGTIIKCCEDTRSEDASTVKVAAAESVAYNTIKRRYEELSDAMERED